MLLPPTDRDPAVLPWKARMVEMYQRPPVLNRASFRAISTASVPQLVKKHCFRSPGVMSATALAR